MRVLVLLISPSACFFIFIGTIPHYYLLTLTIIFKYDEYSVSNLNKIRRKNSNYVCIRNDDDLLNGEDEFDYEDYNLDGEQEEELLQDDCEGEDVVDAPKDKSESFAEDDDEEDVLTLDVDDEERLDKSVPDDQAKEKFVRANDKFTTRTIENKPKPIPTTTNNVNNKKNSPAKPKDRPPRTTKTLTTRKLL